MPCLFVLFLATFCATTALAIHCPQLLDTWSGTLPIQGTNQNVQLVVSPYGVVSAVSTTSGASCFGPGYISTFTSTGICQDYVDVVRNTCQASPDTVQWSYTSTFDTIQVVTTLALSCDGSAAAVGTNFSVTSYKSSQVGGTTLIELAGTSSAVCGTNPSTTTSTTATVVNATTTAPPPMTVTAIPSAYVSATFETVYWEQQMYMAVQNYYDSQTSTQTQSTTIHAPPTTDTTTEVSAATTRTDTATTHQVSPVTTGLNSSSQVNGRNFHFQGVVVVMAISISCDRTTFQTVAHNCYMSFLNPSTCNDTINAANSGLLGGAVSRAWYGTPSPTEAPLTSSPDKADNSKGVIIGSVVGGIVFIALVIGIVVALTIRLKERKRRDSEYRPLDKDGSRVNGGGRTGFGATV